MIVLGLIMNAILGTKHCKLSHDSSVVTLGWAHSSIVPRPVRCFWLHERTLYRTASDGRGLGTRLGMVSDT